MLSLYENMTFKRLITDLVAVPNTGTSSRRLVFIIFGEKKIISKYLQPSNNHSLISEVMGTGDVMKIKIRRT